MGITILFIVFGYLLVAALVVVAVMAVNDDPSAEGQAGAALIAIIWPVAVPLAILIWLFTRLAYGVVKYMNDRKPNNK